MDVRLIIDPDNVFTDVFTDDVLYYANTRAYAYMDKYVPYRDGNLSQDVTITEEYVQYNSKYAQKIYNSKEFNFSKEQHPLATAEWDKAMTVSDKERLAEDIRRYIRR